MSVSPKFRKITRLAGTSAALGVTAAFVLMGAPANAAPAQSNSRGIYSDTNSRGINSDSNSRGISSDSNSRGISSDSNSRGINSDGTSFTDSRGI